MKTFIEVPEFSLPLLRLPCLYFNIDFGLMNSIDTSPKSLSAFFSLRINFSSMYSTNQISQCAISLSMCWAYYRTCQSNYFILIFFNLRNLFLIFADITSVSRLGFSSSNKEKFSGGKKSHLISSQKFKFSMWNNDINNSHLSGIIPFQTAESSFHRFVTKFFIIF